jgi:hypothetical protein
MAEPILNLEELKPRILRMALIRKAESGKTRDKSQKAAGRWATKRHKSTVRYESARARAIQSF